MATVNYSTRVEDGTKTAPSYSFRQDTDTGIYRIGANNLGVSVGDTKILDLTTTNVGITGIVALNTASPKADSGGLDISGGGLSLVLGADADATTRTNATNKDGRIACAHYTNAEEPVAIALAASKAATSVISFGGGSGSMNAVTSLEFYTAANVTTVTGTKQLDIGSTGQVLALTATGGLGYGTGAGGAVTQITSRTTGVTLNTVCGAITLVSAAGSGTYATFTVTNSTVAATDVVYVAQKSGADTYEIQVTAVAAGSFNISFRSAVGTTTEQPVFNFVVIKAVAA